ncbi:hypothetical protein [Acinetobacter sp. WZC-1]|uniref:hypothetical protein n=1 Tax=Acinetobacter sp. WZC-1 TaxID=3459034 RepID=UPI00403D7714
MMHCSDGDHQVIHYISDYKMTILGRYVPDELGRTVFETFWVGGGAITSHTPGPVVFVSALDAEIIRQLANQELAADEKEWLCYDLNLLDLPQMMTMLNGLVTLHIFVAYLATQLNTLVTSHVVSPRMSLIPFSFSRPPGGFPEDGSQVTFEFHPRLFSGLREYWSGITTDDYADSLALINNRDTEELVMLAQQAIQSIQILPMEQVKFGLIDQLAVFSLTAGIWRFGEDRYEQPPGVS